MTKTELTKTELITKILKLKNKENDVLELKMLYQLDKDYKVSMRLNLWN